jgi:hypothetical protein
MIQIGVFQDTTRYDRSSAAMPKQTLSALQEGFYEEASVLFALADVLDPINLDPDDDDNPEEVAQTLAQGNSDVAAVLRIYGALAVEDAQSFESDGTCGHYFQVEKSKDWFTCALNMPDREFQSIFRYVWSETFSKSCSYI